MEPCVEWGVTYVTAFVYALGSVVCHQIPERSFYWGAVQFPVCARCTGLYLGGVVGMLAVAAIRRPLSPPAARRVVAIAAIPTALTVATAMLGWWDPANIWRFSFAVPLGLTVGVVVGAALSGKLR